MNLLALMKTLKTLKEITNEDIKSYNQRRLEQQDDNWRLLVLLKFQYVFIIFIAPIQTSNDTILPDFFLRMFLSFSFYILYFSESGYAYSTILFTLKECSKIIVYYMSLFIAGLSTVPSPKNLTLR